MKLAYALSAFLFSAAFAQADIVVIENVQGMAQSGPMTLMVGAGKVRTDANPQISIISDTVTGDSITIMHQQKAYMVVPASLTRALLNQNATPSASPAALVATGKTDKINGHNATEYTFSGGNMKAIYWMSPDFPNAKMVLDALAAFRKGGLANMTKGLVPDISTLPGVPVKTEVEVNGQKIITELISAKEQPVDPSEYQVPAGYTEIKMPSMQP